MTPAPEEPELSGLRAGDRNTAASMRVKRAPVCSQKRGRCTSVSGSPSLTGGERLPEALACCLLRSVESDWVNRTDSNRLSAARRRGLEASSRERTCLAARSAVCNLIPFPGARSSPTASCTSGAGCSIGRTGTVCGLEAACGNATLRLGSAAPSNRPGAEDPPTILRPVDSRDGSVPDGPEEAGPLS
jgi:hypothetical protein